MTGTIMEHGSVRLRGSREIARALRDGDRRRGRLVTVAVYERGDERPPRLAVVASRRVGAAVQRNRAKRLLREAARALAWEDGRDIVLVARPGLASAQLDDATTDLGEVAGRLGALG
jgi:ribonuclease P protein component